MERERKALVAAGHAAATVLTVLGAVAEAKQLPDDLERAVQVPCQHNLTDGSQEPPDEGSAPPRDHRVNAGPGSLVVHDFAAVRNTDTGPRLTRGVGKDVG